MKSGEIILRKRLSDQEELVIRYPVKEDAKILCDYMNTLSKEKTFITFQGEILSLEEEIKYLNSFINKIENGKAVKLFAFVNDKLIGVSDIVLGERTSAHVGTFGITIAKEFRNKGIGKLLIKTALEEAKKNIKDLKIITLGVFANNNIAFEIYKKFGFVEHGRLPKGIKHKEEFIDHINMHKNIEKD